MVTSETSLLVDLRRLHRAALWSVSLTSKVLTAVEKSATLKGSSAGGANQREIMNRVGAGTQLDLYEEYEQVGSSGELLLGET